MVKQSDTENMRIASKLYVTGRAGLSNFPVNEKPKCFVEKQQEGFLISFVCVPVPSEITEMLPG
ncbi:unnamed protein product, partial [Ixodes pacificus]